MLLCDDYNTYSGQEENLPGPQHHASVTNYLELTGCRACVCQICVLFCSCGGGGHQRSPHGAKLNYQLEWHLVHGCYWVAGGVRFEQATCVILIYVEQLCLVNTKEHHGTVTQKQCRSLRSKWVEDTYYHSFTWPVCQRPCFKCEASLYHLPSRCFFPRPGNRTASPTEPGRFVSLRKPSSYVFKALNKNEKHRQLFVQHEICKPSYLFKARNKYEGFQSYARN